MTALNKLHRTIDRLLFIYDADRGPVSAFIDSAKKLLMVKGCALCSITHGTLGEKGEWKSCRDELGVPIDYVHRDEVTEELGKIVGDNLPCIVAWADNEYILFITPDVLERCRGSAADLLGRIEFRASMQGLVLPNRLVA